MSSSTEISSHVFCRGAENFCAAIVSNLREMAEEAGEVSDLVDTVHYSTKNPTAAHPTAAHPIEAHPIEAQSTAGSPAAANPSPDPAVQE